MIDPGLEGRVVLVTGANSGIGAATVRAFAAQGATVVLHYLDRQRPPGAADVRIEHETPGAPAAEAIVQEIVASGGRAFAAAADLSDPVAARLLLVAAEAHAGPVEVLVNNAAHCESPDSILEITTGTLDRHFAVNTRAPVLLTREFAHRYRERDATWGRIINLSTDAARAFAGQIAYGASKAALEAFTRSTAVELGPLGITVNAVAPGPVQTGWITADLEEQIRPSIPMGRVGTPEDVAGVIVFLASEQARWITGQVVQVAGGHAL
jgi:3-oxoacyl-[acyl-carrier protein] reductase